MQEQELPEGEIGFPADYRLAAITLARRARRELRIFSPELNAELYSDQELAEAVSAMARRHRGARVHIIVMNDAQMANRSHRLIDLVRQLPSLCQIRILKDVPDRFREDYLLADREGLLHRKGQEENLALLQYSARAEVADRAEHFDHLWQRAEPSPEFRQLSI